MRRLDKVDYNTLAFINRCGGSYCPNDDACAEPFIMDTLNALVKVKRLRIEETDAGPRFHLTELGKSDAAGV